MEIKKNNIMELLIVGSKYNIPFYQRKYDWKESEIKRLISDIQNNINSEYFLGTLVFKHYKFNEYTIIDGQQRISSIYLILKALYDHENIYDEYKTQIKKIFEFFSFVSKNKSDNVVLEKIIKNQNLTDKDMETNYYKNYVSIKNHFNNLTWKINDFINSLWKVIFSILTISHKEVDEHILFSQINSTGKKLTGFDLFKNHIFSKMFHDFEPGFENYDKVDKFIEAKLEIFDEVTSYLSSKSNEVDDLLRRFLSYETSSLPNKSNEKIYEAYLKYYIDEEHKANDTLTAFNIFNRFLSFAIIYKYIYNQEWKNEPFKEEMAMIFNSFKTYVNVLVNIIEENSSKNHAKIIMTEIQKENIKDALLVLEIYKIKRIFCDMPEKNITRFIPTLPNNIVRIPGNFTYAEKLYFFISTLPNRVNETYTYELPSNEKFNLKFKTFSLYENGGQKFTKLFLERIANSYNGKNLLKYENYTVEHIMPQKLDIWYQNGFKEDAMQIVELMHTIGNLTLTPYNSEYSNKLFQIKKEQMCKNEIIIMNRWIVQQNEWNLETIKQRADILLQEVNKIYDLSKIIHQKNQDKIFEIYNEIKNDLIKYESFSEEIIDDIRKNSANLKKINELDYQKIFDVVSKYKMEKMSYEEIEDKCFGIKLKGWLSRTIIKAFGFKANNKDEKVTWTINELEEMLAKKKINLFLTLFDEIKNNKDI